jgi:two-component system NarL family sensor kinase
MEVEDPAGYGPSVDELVFRACQEALRNVEEHADAAHVTVRVRREGALAVLEVQDDGRGIGEAGASPAKDGGHVGLQILGDVVRDGGGTLSVGPADGRGTLLRLEVPIP